MSFVAVLGHLWMTLMSVLHNNADIQDEETQGLLYPKAVSKT